VPRGTDGRIDAAWVMRAGEWASRTGRRWTVSSSRLLPVGGADTIRQILPPGPENEWARVWLARGFIDEVECPAAWWLEVADAITAAHPVRRVELTTWPDVIFAATRTDEYEDKVLSGRRLVTRWRAYCGGMVTDFGREVSITRRDEFEGNESLIREMINHRVEADRTPQAYLRARWEKIEFELPPPAPDYWGPPPVGAAMPTYQALRDAQDRLIRYFQRTAGAPEWAVSPAPPPPPG
jgi:hypothetical protein